MPEIVALTGCSIRTAQENSVAQRRAMIEKRDRLIWAMHREGRTQEAIGAALEVPQRTIANVIERLSQKRGAAQMAKPKLRDEEPPKAVDPEPEADQDPGPAEVEAAAVQPAPDPKPEAPPSYRIDVSWPSTHPPLAFWTALQAMA